MFVKKHLLVLAVMAFSLSGCVSFGAAKKTEQYVQTIASERKIAEFWVSVLKYRQKPELSAYRKGQALYEAAGAQFEGWLEQYKFDITNGSVKKNRKALKADLIRATEARMEFTRYMEQIEPEFKQSVYFSTPYYSWIADATDAVIKIWQVYKAADEERRSKLIQQIDGLKWQPFVAVPPMTKESESKQPALTDDRL